jgi:hypothetical protein
LRFQKSSKTAIEKLKNRRKYEDAVIERMLGGCYLLSYGIATILGLHTTTIKVGLGYPSQ